MVIMELVTEPVQPKKKAGSTTVSEVKPAAAPAVAAPAAAPAAPRTYVPGPELKDKSPELYAVITAAVSEEMRKKGVNPEGGFKIKSIKRK